MKSSQNSRVHGHYNRKEIKKNPLSKIQRKQNARLMVLNPINLSKNGNEAAKFSRINID